MVNCEWKKVCLKDAADFLDHLRKPVSSSDRAKMKGVYPYYGASGIVDYVNDYIYDEPLILLGEDGENILSRNLPLAFLVDGKIWVNNHAHVLRAKEGVNRQYLCAFLESLDYTDLNSGTAQPKLNQEKCKNIEIYLPEFEEQTAIAEALSDMDSLISSLQKLIEKKKAIKQGTMQELLTGKKRLPGFYGKWRIVQIGETLSIGHGQSQKAVENRFGKYPILATGGCIGYANDFLWDKPSVLIGRKGTIDKPQYADYPFWTIDTLFYTKIFDGYDAKFIYYKFCMIDWQQYNEASGVPSLNATTIENLQIIVPEKDEQQAIAQLLSDIDSEIEQLEKKLAKYQQIKQGMMQELLTGRIRLVDG